MRPARGGALRSRLVWLCLIGIALFALVAALAPAIAPHDPYRWEPTRPNLLPAWRQAPGDAGGEVYPLGTDRYGRDVFSRLVYGARTAFLLALAAVPLAALIGTSLGLIAGYKGGRLDAMIVYLMDVVQSLPGIMFIVVVVLIFRGRTPATWGSGLLTLVVGYVVFSWASLARLVRASVLQLNAAMFIEAAISTGVRGRRIMLRHLLPNVAHVVWFWVIMSIPGIILLEALLGYIGVGLTAAVDGSEFTAVSWGGLFYSSRAALRSNPLMLILPSLGILLISMSFILLADFLSGTEDA
jgi:ABC-type dipeptide/oligopeptide/nickel transport system permease subunit